MPKTICAVPYCSNTGDHRIPKDKELRDKWIRAIKRGKTRFVQWSPQSKFSYICREHFTEDDYISLSFHGTTVSQRRLKKSAVPSQFHWTKETQTPSVKARKDRSLRRNLFRDITNKPTEDRMSTDIDPPVYIGDVGANETLEMECDVTSDSDDVNVDQVETVTLCSSETQTPKQPMFSAENFRNDDAGIHFYTGLENIFKFYLVLHSLGPAAFCLNYAYHNIVNISVPDQFFMVLMKLRRHTTHFELSRLFSISEKAVSNIFLTWICFMYRQWYELNIWPTQELVRYFAPTGFRQNYPKTRVIIDGTECPVKKPRNPKSQQATFSTYKNRNTVKVLVGASPGGLISFVSNAYAGSTSDRQIVERSSLLRICDPKDSIMADKGFNVQDLFAPYDVAINIPTFFKKKNRMSNETVMRDRKISSKRVHIERLIGLVKTYKILMEPMSATEAKLSTEIIFVCCMLCNFRNCIIPSNA